MRPTLVSPFLILVLLGCPLWCSWAAAHGVSCCGNHAEVVVAQPVEPACCCCHNDAAETPAVPTQGHSDACHCQGICGGAVLDGNVVFDLPAPLSLDVPLASDAWADSSRQLQAFAFARTAHSFPDATETLRALHVLILC